MTGVIFLVEAVFFHSSLEGLLGDRIRGLGD